MASGVKLDYYELTGRFGSNVWRKFVRNHLKLDDPMEKFKDAFPNDFKEQKIQIVKHWQKLDKKHTETRFRQLKHNFLCGAIYREEQTITTCTRASSDDSPIPVEDHKVRPGLQLAYPRRNGRGLALIISNSFEGFGEHHREPACTKDLENMENLWKDVFGCDLLGGRVHKDKTAKEMRYLMKRMAEEGGKYHFVVVVISTHGGSKTIDKGEETQFVDCLVGNDGKLIYVRELQKFFNNDGAKKLQNIPKLFILQYCRGREIDQGVLRASDSDSDDPYAFSGDESRLLPTVSDVATVFATQASYAAWKNENGSWLITYISEVFRTLSDQQVHVIDMLTVVNDHMKNHDSESDGKDAKAMSIIESSFTKQLLLIPVVETAKVGQLPDQQNE